MNAERAQKWDEFACAALSGACANPESGANSPRDLAWYAASVADSMMKQRDERFGKNERTQNPE